LNRLPLQEQTRFIASVITTTLMALSAVTMITACSPKSSTEENAAKSKASFDQAVGEAKIELIAEQAAKKAKQDAIAAAQAEEKIKHDAAVAEAKKELIAEQRSTESKAKASKSSSEPTPTNKIVCKNCGVVLSVKEIETEGKGSGLGVVAGGVVGGLLGNQVGNGTGRDLATIAGAVGGAFAGNTIEKNSKKTKSYDITVKMETGEEQIVHQATAPDVVKGDMVKIENDVIVKK
jgi:outer membrane lipoprotein SlyB